MPTHAKIVFPAPPPTFNSLTSTQRAQLLRSTKKLERLLGTAPRLLDENLEPAAVRHIIDLPLRTSSRRPSISDTLSESESSSSTLYSPDEASFGRRSSSSLSRRSTGGGKLSRYIEAYPGQKKLPLLRVRFSATPTSSPFDPLTSSTSTSDLDDEDSKFTLRPTPQSPTISSTAPTFSIPSAGSARRQKMDRLRRKLGDGVPLELVFAQSHEESLEEVRPGAVTNVASTYAITTTPTPTPTSTPPATIRCIATARDSIALPSTHKAHRIKRKPVPKLVPQATRPAPPPPVSSKTPAPVAVGISNVKGSKLKPKERLSLIIENPDEQVMSFLKGLDVHLVRERWSSESGYTGDSEPSPSPVSA